MFLFWGGLILTCLWGFTEYSNVRHVSLGRARVLGKFLRTKCGLSGSITRLALGLAAPAWRRSLSVLGCCVTYLSLCVVKVKVLVVKNLEVGIPEV